MYCKHCGKEIDGSLDTCVHCGAKIQGARNTVQAGSPLEKQAIAGVNPSKPGKKKLVNKVALVGLVLCILGLFLQYLASYFSILIMASFFFGLFSYLQIKKGSQSGAWMSWIAMILGGINILVFLSSFLSALNG